MKNLKVKGWCMAVGVAALLIGYHGKAAPGGTVPANPNPAPPRTPNLTAPNAPVPSGPNLSPPNAPVPAGPNLTTPNNPAVIPPGNPNLIPPESPNVVRPSNVRSNKFSR